MTVNHVNFTYRIAFFLSISRRGKGEFEKSKGLQKLLCSSVNVEFTELAVKS